MIQTGGGYGAAVIQEKKYKWLPPPFPVLYHCRTLLPLQNEIKEIRDRQASRVVGRKVEHGEDLVLCKRSA